MQQRDKTSKVVRTEMKPIRDLLVIPDILQSQKYFQKVKVHFKLSQADQKKFDLVLQQQKKTVPQYVPKKNQPQPQSSDDQTSKQSLTSNSDFDSANFQSDVQQQKQPTLQKSKPTSESQLRYIFTPLNSLKDFFIDIYQKDLPDLEKRFKCEILKNNDNTIEIRCDDAKNIPSIKDEFFNKCQNIHFCILDSKQKLIIHSKMVEESLKMKKLFMIRKKNFNVIWSERKYMKEVEFKQMVTELITRKCKRRILVLLREPIRRSPSIKNQLSDFFELFKLKSQRNYKKIEEIYNIVIEYVPKYHELIIHLEDIEFFEQVSQLIRSQFQDLVLFSFTTNLTHLKQLQLLNHCQRYYQFVECKIFNKKRFTVAFPISQIKKHFLKFIREISALKVIGSGSELMVCFTNLKDGMTISHVLNNNLPQQVMVNDRVVVSMYKGKIIENQGEAFVEVLAKLGGILVGESLEQEEVSQTMTINQSYSREMSMSDSLTKTAGDLIESNYEENNEKNESKWIDEKDYQAIDKQHKKSQSYNQSKSSSASHQSSDEQLKEHKNLQQSNQQHPLEQQEYNLTFPLTFRLSSSTKGFQINSKFQQKQQLQTFIQNRIVGREFMTKCLLLPREWEEIKLESPMIYAMNQEFVMNDKPRQEVKIMNINSKVQKFKYLVQATNVYEEEGDIKVKYGYYLPVYQVKQL